MGTQENKEVVRRLHDELNRKNFAALDGLIAPTFVHRNPADPSMAKGPAGMRSLYEKWLAAFPDGEQRVEDQIAEGDKVVTRLRGRATFLGECLGIPPNGKVVEITGISIHRIADGKLVEHWANADLLSLMQQLGAIPTPEPVTG